MFLHRALGQSNLICAIAPLAHDHRTVDPRTRQSGSLNCHQLGEQSINGYLGKPADRGVQLHGDASPMRVSITRMQVRAAQAAGLPRDHQRTGYRAISIGSDKQVWPCWLLEFHCCDLGSDDRMQAQDDEQISLLRISAAREPCGAHGQIGRLGKHV